MAIPTFGGMLFEVITMLVVPVLYCWREESRLLRQKPEASRSFVVQDLQ
jgi:Cu(I)/Ag(I) efflux system membrane protein CusA/SilA